MTVEPGPFPLAADVAAPWLLTGATGMIGPAIVDEIVASGRQVRVLTRQPSRPPDGWPWQADDDAVEVFSGDVRDAAALRSAMEGVAVVVHAAGVAHRPPRSPDDARELFDANVAGARAIAKAATTAAVRRVVFISSAAVYGPGGDGPRTESAPARPVTAYGRSKLESERVLTAELGEALTVLRVSAVYGPRQRGNYATLDRVVRSAWPIPVVQGFGHCLIHDRDLARAVTRIALEPGAAGNVLNVSDGRRYSVGEIVAELSAATGTPRWRTPILPAPVGSAAVRLLTLTGGAEWTTRQRLARATQALTSGPALDTSALRAVLGSWDCPSITDGRSNCR